MSLKTFLKTQNKEHTYVIYIGYDTDDRIFALESSRDEIIRFSLVFTNVSFQFIQFTNIQKGHLTKMWNVLYRAAYDDQCDYFYQCGDDIIFHTDGWVNDTIQTMIANRNIGISGPINNNPTILTQAMFSRTHMEIFGWMFPEEILNWCCDDWYNYLYRPNLFYPLMSHQCYNAGGAPRYDIHGNPEYDVNNMSNNVKLRIQTDQMRQYAAELAKKHVLILAEYLRGPRKGT
jgi:hypothetical protein